MHLDEILTLDLEFRLGAELSEFINMPLYLLFKEKAKNYRCYLEFSQIIISENTEQVKIQRIHNVLEKWQNE